MFVLLTAMPVTFRPPAGAVYAAGVSSDTGTAYSTSAAFAEGTGDADGSLQTAAQTRPAETAADAGRQIDETSAPAQEAAAADTQQKAEEQAQTDTEKGVADTEAADRKSSGDQELTGADSEENAESGAAGDAGEGRSGEDGKTAAPAEQAPSSGKSGEESDAGLEQEGENGAQDLPAEDDGKALKNGAGTGETGSDAQKADGAQETGSDALKTGGSAQESRSDAQKTGGSTEESAGSRQENAGADTEESAGSRQESAGADTEESAGSRQESAGADAADTAEQTVIEEEPWMTVTQFERALQSLSKGSGMEGVYVPDEVRIISKEDEIDYESLGIGNENGHVGHTTVINARDEKGNDYEGVCVIPDDRGMPRWSVLPGVTQVTDAVMIKLYYYTMLDGYGEKLARQRGFGDNSREVAVAACHEAMSKRYAALAGIVYDRPNIGSNLLALIDAYYSAVTSKPLPDMNKVHIYVSGRTQIDGHWMQAYVFGLIEKEEPSGIILTKTTSDPDIRYAYSSYDLCRTENGGDVTFGFYTDKACTKKAGIYGDQNMTAALDVITVGMSGVSGLWNQAVFYCLPGTYYLKELTSPKGYQAPGEVFGPYEVTEGKGMRIKIANTPRYAKAGIIKKEAETGKALAGAKYGLYADKEEARNGESPVGTFTTGADGKSNTLEVLADKAYYVREISAPKGYKKDDGIHALKIAKSVKDTVWTELTDEPETGRVQVKKTSEDPAAVTEDNALYSLKGAVYTLYDADGRSAGTLKTEKDGSSNVLTVRCGSYTVKETSPSAGFKLDTAVHKVTVTGGELSTVQSEEPVIKGKITVKKVSSEEKDGKASDTMPITGAQYTLYKSKEDAEKKSGGAGTFTVKADGSSNVIEVLGGKTYYVRETKTPQGYLTDETIHAVKVDSLTKTIEVHSEDRLIFGGVKVCKRDLSTGENTPLGGASLEGTVMKIYNDGDLSVYADGKKILPGAEVMTLTTGADGTAQTNARALSYGSYRVEEILPPEGYTRQGAAPVRFKVLEDGKITDLSSMKDTSVNNRVMRGDFSIRKINGYTQKRMAGVTFEVTSYDRDGNEVEKHRFTTDKNGCFDSTAEWAAQHKDSERIWFGIGTEPDDRLGALPYGSYHIEEIEGENNQGMKMFSDDFSIYADGQTLDLGNIENTLKPVLETELVDENGDHFADQKGIVTLTDLVTYGGMEEYIGKEVTFHGVIYVKETGEPLQIGGRKVECVTTRKILSSSATVQLRFTFDASEAQGMTLVCYEYASEAVTPQVRPGTDTPGSETSGTEEDTPETYHDSTNGGSDIASHTDIDDEAQTVHLVSIETDAEDQLTGMHIGQARDGAVTVDHVTCKGLIPGYKYLVTGFLVDKTTGRPLRDAQGADVTAKASFTAQKAEETVDLTFTYDASLLEGTTVVAFERLYLEGDGTTDNPASEEPDGDSPDTPDSEEPGTDTPIAVHEDPDDEDQSVHYPEIRTDAAALKNSSDSSTQTGSGTEAESAENSAAAAGESESAENTSAGTEETETVKTVTADGKLIIRDHVTWKNLLPGKTYCLQGTLMRKDTGSPLTIDNKTVTAEAEFTPDTKDGETDLDFAFRAEGLFEDTEESGLQSMEIVAFEELYIRGGNSSGEETTDEGGSSDPADTEDTEDSGDSGSPEHSEASAETGDSDNPDDADGHEEDTEYLVAEHKDLGDPAQTVVLTKPEKPVTPEQPEKPGQPEKPEQPEKPQTPEDSQVTDYPELIPEPGKTEPPAVTEKEESGTQTAKKKTAAPASPETISQGSRVRTGDDTNIAVFLIPAALAALGIAVLLFAKRRAGKK